jgi:hypothetical protein
MITDTKEETKNNLQAELQSLLGGSVNTVAVAFTITTTLIYNSFWLH